MPAADSSWKPIDSLAADANGDGQITLADLPDFFGKLFFLPGDALIWAASTHAAPIARFLEIGPADYGGVLSGFISTCVWLTAVIGASIAYQYVLDVDRRVTQATTQCWASLGLRVRIARALLRQRWRALLAGRPPSNRVDFATDLDLSPKQIRTLQLHAELSAGYALPVSDVARALGSRRAPTQDLLDGLKELGLLDRTIGGTDGESAYTLSAAGRAFLVFRQLTPARHG